MKNMIYQIYLAFIISTVLLLIQTKRNMELKRNFEIYKSVMKCKIDNLNDRLQEEIERADMAEMHFNMNGFPRYGHGFLENENNQRNTIPRGTLEAVKYAMNKSHPDNGGNQEDFIKFRKLYEELKGMNL